VPPPKRPPVSRPAPALGAYRAVIDEWLVADREAPRKQRHTARRVWQRLVEEHGASVSERQVARCVRARRRELGEVGEAFVPLVSEPGVEAEVDWGQASVLVRGAPTVVHLFVMRACYSGAAFVMAFERETQQAFLEGHVAALEWFGGVFDVVRYDNLKAAVAQVLKGRRRVESDRFVALRSHYLFESSFCQSGQRGAHEKGGVEGDGVGRFRRRHLVPVPEVGSIAQLNELLERACLADLARTVTGRRVTVGEALAQERRLLSALPAERYDPSEHARPRVDSKAMVTVRQNRYSVPVGLVGLRVSAVIAANEITIRHDGRIVAVHERMAGRFGASAQLDHYLELLALKPRGLARSLALAQARERGAWPGCFDELWRAIEARVGRSEAARQIVDVLLLCREHGPERVELAVRGALAASAHDGRAVAVLARQAGRPIPATLQLDERLAAIGAPPPADLSGYDALRHPGAGR
jgi:transposase